MRKLPLNLLEDPLPDQLLPQAELLKTELFSWDECPWVASFEIRCHLESLRAAAQSAGMEEVASQILQIINDCTARMVKTVGHTAGTWK